MLFRSQIKAYIAAVLPSVITGDTIGHVNILLDDSDRIVRTTSGASHAVKAFLTGTGVGTGHRERYAIKRQADGSGRIDFERSTMDSSSFNLDGIDPAKCKDLYLYVFAPGEIGPRNLTVAVLVLKPTKPAD